MKNKELKNQRIIIINGIARGGTNLLWNIMQSHPLICSPIYETGGILKSNNPYLYILSNKLNTLGVLTNAEIFTEIGLSLKKRISKHLDSSLYSYKLKNIDDTNNQWKNENSKYTFEEIKNCILCTKSLNSDIFLTPHLINLYPNIKIINIVRDGFSICESWKRRGHKADKIGKLYSTYVNKMIDLTEKYDDSTVVKFEDLLQNPFKISKQLFEFCELEPTKLEKLRLKSKKTLSQNGEHRKHFGQEHKKYWFDQESINNFLISNINNTQKNNLSVQDIKAFEKYAKSTLEFFNYR